MSTERKPADKRVKDLRLAMFRIQQGRPQQTKTTKLSIASVAAEAGVSAALIHNHYPEIADAIRLAQGQSSRAQRDLKQEELKVERGKNREFRREIASLRGDISRLASINEVLRTENATLRARLGDPGVFSLVKRT